MAAECGNASCQGILSWGHMLPGHRVWLQELIRNERLIWDNKWPVIKKSIEFSRECWLTRRRCSYFPKLTYQVNHVTSCPNNVLTIIFWRLSSHITNDVRARACTVQMAAVILVNKRGTRSVLVAFFRRRIPVSCLSFCFQYTPNRIQREQNWQKETTKPSSIW